MRNKSAHALAILAHPLSIIWKVQIYRLSTWIRNLKPTQSACNSYLYDRPDSSWTPFAAPPLQRKQHVRNAPLAHRSSYLPTPRFIILSMSLQRTLPPFSIQFSSPRTSLLDYVSAFSQLSEFWLLQAPLSLNGTSPSVQTLSLADEN